MEKFVYVISGSNSRGEVGFLARKENPKGRPRFRDGRNFDALWLTEDPDVAYLKMRGLEIAGYINKFAGDGIVKIKNDNGLFDKTLKEFNAR